MDKEQADPGRDRELGMDRPITRRDFLNGIALGIGGAMAGVSISGADWLASAQSFAQDSPGYYPPALTGMRGSHDGSYDVAHALRDGTFWKTAGKPVDTREAYDVVIVGAGISGLAAAHFYRARAGRGARILILDNHDDFGGHARRNEFRPGGQLWIANGGTAGIESPFPYSSEARALMTELGVDPVALSEHASKGADRSTFAGLRAAVFFDRETFGEDRLAVGMPGADDEGASDGPTPWSVFAEKTPLGPEARRDLVRLNEAKVDYLPGLSSAEKKARLAAMSYKDFLLNVVRVRPEVVKFYQARTHGLYGVGIDAIGALECWAYHYPGFAGMDLDPAATGRMSFTARGDATPKPEYGFHHPDGGASVARHLVRALIPDAMPGQTAEDLVTAKADDSHLGGLGASVRIRLSSTAVRATHVGGATGKEVEVAYARENRVYTVRAKGVVLACWNMAIPFLVPELPEKQKEALRYGVKVPLVYTSVAVKNWRAFKTLGMSRVSAPGMYHSSVRLEQPTIIGDYHPEVSPDKPILLRMLRTPCSPGNPARVQHRIGHVDLLTTKFSTFERNIRDQLARVLAAGGFDPARDIDAITVNRWPHGYAYEYNPLWDPEWAPGEAPCEIGRKQFGRITIANSDAAAAAYMDQAMDQAYRAVQELLATS
jgi:spermidine dehydrogenase